VTLSEYYDLLEEHDWYYAFSDDMRIYSKGEKQEMYLTGVAQRNGISFQNLYDAFHHYHFSGQQFGTVKADKPTRPMEE